MPIADLFGLIRQKKQTDTDKYLASSVNIVSTGEKGQLRPPFSQQRGINAFHSWVYAAATINANAVAAVPLRLYKKADKRTRQKTRAVPLRTKAYLLGDAAGDQRPSMSVLRKVAEFGDEVEEVTGSDPILDLLSTANPFLNGFDLTVLRVLYGELTGNSYLHPIIDDDTDMPSELWPLAPNYVEVVPCEENFIKGYVYGIDSSKKQTFEPDEVIHFKRPNPGNYFYGMGKVEAAFGAVLSNDAVHQMDLSTFANSARPDYAVVVKGTPTGDQLDRFQQQVEERLKGTRKDGNFIAVSGDVQFTPLNFPPKDVAGREDIVEEISAIFGVPVSMLKANDPNLASAKMGFSQWREGTVLPLCRMDEQELNQSLLPMFGAEDEYFLAYDNPVPKDESFDLQQRQTAVAGGWRTPNEARLEEGREPIEDPMADSLLYSGQPLGGAGAGGIIPPFGGGLPSTEAAPVEDVSEASPDAPEAEGTPAESGPTAPVPADPTANLNGAQIQSVIAILDGVAAGTIAQSAAVELIMATGVSRESATRMVGDQDEAKPEAQAEAEIEQAIEPMTEEQKSRVNMATVADVSMALRGGYLSKFEATKTLQAAGMTRKHAERLVKSEAAKAKILRSEDDLYESAEEAEQIAEVIGCEGHHTHDVGGQTMYMPCSEMDDYTELTGDRHESDEDLELVEDKAIEDIDLKPTATMADLAARGLELREEHGRGGTEVGVARARDIKNRDNLSPETVGRMVNFFSRHRVDLDAPAAKPGHKDYPSAGVIAWLLWGGDPADPDGGGHAWAKGKKEQIDREREGQKGGGVTGLVPKIWGTQLSANARTALGRLILEKADDCGTGAGGFKPGNDCAEGHGRPEGSKNKPKTDTPEFEQWFGASVEQEDGSPREMYHGTAGVFDEFAPGITWVSEDEDHAQLYADAAQSMTGTEGGVIPLYVRSEKPVKVADRPKNVRLDTLANELLASAREDKNTFDIKEAREALDKFRRGWESSGADIKQERPRHEWWFDEGRANANEKNFSALVQSLGYDSVEYYETIGGYRGMPERRIRTVGVFDSNQLKSSSDNDGNFSRDSGDITKSADNCGTGAGGFQEDNDCAEGHGRPTKEQMDAKQREQQASPEFKDFFKQSQVVDKDGNPLVVWHGTHAEIDESFAFEKERIGSATDEGFYGRGFYFVGYTDQSLGTGRGEANYYGPNTHGFYLSAQKVLNFETTDPLTSIDQGLDSLVGLRDTLEEVDLWKGIAGDPDDPSYGLDATIKEYRRSLEAIDENVEIRRHADRLDGKGNWSAAIKMPDDTLTGGREYSLTPTYNRADTDTRKNERVYYETKAEAVRALKKKVWNDIQNEYDDLLYSPTSLSDYLRTAYSSREITEKAEAAGYDGIRFGDEWIVFDPSQIKSATLNEGNFDPKDPRISKSADNCGTGAGGFSEGNNCAEGHGRPTTEEARAKGPDASKVGGFQDQQEFEDQVKEAGTANGVPYVEVDEREGLEELNAMARNTESEHWSPQDIEENVGIKPTDAALSKNGETTEDGDPLSAEQQKVWKALKEYSRSEDINDYLRDPGTGRFADKPLPMDELRELDRSMKQHTDDGGYPKKVILPALITPRDTPVPPDERQAIVDFFAENKEGMTADLNRKKEILVDAVASVTGGTDRRAFGNEIDEIENAVAFIDQLASNEPFLANDNDRVLKSHVKYASRALSAGTERAMNAKQFTVPGMAKTLNDAASQEFAKPVTVYRGIKDLGSSTNNLGKELLDLDGDLKFKLEGMGSASASPSVARRFSQGSYGVGAIMKIKAKRGITIGRASGFAEAEVVLPHGAEYRITDRYWADIRGTVTMIVECEEVD